MAGKVDRRERGRRAGASAEPTPQSRLGWPEALRNRLEKAGIKTRPFEKGGVRAIKKRGRRRKQQATVLR